MVIWSKKHDNRPDRWADVVDRTTAEFKQHSHLCFGNLAGTKSFAVQSWIMALCKAVLFCLGTIISNITNEKVWMDGCY